MTKQALKFLAWVFIIIPLSMLLGVLLYEAIAGYNGWQSITILL